jgi:hypothetical protein
LSFEIPLNTIKVPLKQLVIGSSAISVTCSVCVIVPFSSTTITLWNAIQPMAHL